MLTIIRTFTVKYREKETTKKAEAECSFCGNVVIRTYQNALRQQSCGCFKRTGTNSRRYKHGRDPWRLYIVWKDMRRRCNNKTDSAYWRYGAVGIKVCQEWNDFSVFRDWALTNGWRPGLFLDRECNSEGYNPLNCRFVSPLESSRNRKYTLGIEEIKAIQKFSSEGMSVNSIAKKIGRGWGTVKKVVDGSYWKLGG